jgi:hypothetical protein
MDDSSHLFLPRFPVPIYYTAPPLADSGTGVTKVDEPCGWLKEYRSGNRADPRWWKEEA